MKDVTEIALSLVKIAAAIVLGWLSWSFALSATYGHGAQSIIPMVVIPFVCLPFLFSGIKNLRKQYAKK